MTTRLKQDINNDYTIEQSKNDSCNLAFLITDDFGAALDLTGITTTFKLFDNESEIDLNDPVDSWNCTNDSDQVGNKGICTLEIATSEIQALERKSYIFEIRTPFDSVNYNKSSKGNFLVL